MTTTDAPEPINTTEVVTVVPSTKPSASIPHRFNRFVAYLKAQSTTENFGKGAVYLALSYAFVSNMTYITLVIVSWIIHGRASGLSPLAKGQWKPFLAIYAGLWAANNVLRPLRFATATAISPLFDKLLKLIQDKTGFKPASCAAIVVFIVNVIGTCAYLFFGLSLATAVTGVPLFP
jgi:hypothetical protein